MKKIDNKNIDLYQKDYNEKIDYFIFNKYNSYISLFIIFFFI